MTYKDSLTASMDFLAQDPARVFIGYNTGAGTRAGGTMKNIPPVQCVEMPVAENLMMGAAIGMALAGYKPVVYIERMDFLLNAMDALVNHLDKIASESGGEFSPRVLIRVNVGSVLNPLFTGATHTQDFSGALGSLLKETTVIPIRENPLADFQRAGKLLEAQSVLTVEWKDLWAKEVA